MELFGLFIGQLVLTAIYMVIAALVGQLAVPYIICFCIGMLFISIVSSLMFDNNGIARVVLFCIGMALLIIPSFILNINVIINQTGSIFEVSFFAVCAGVVFVTWIVCGYTDFYWYMLNVLVIAGIVVLAIIINAIAKSILITSIVCLVIGIIALAIMLIMRIVRGSALND